MLLSQLITEVALPANIASVVDVGISDHLSFFTVSGFIQQDIPEGTVRKRYLTTEVAANFVDLLCDTTAYFLPSSCDFIVDSFNGKLKIQPWTQWPH